MLNESLVEFYDFHKDPITAYFLERIQAVSTNQRRLSAVSVLVKKGTEGSLPDDHSRPLSPGVSSRGEKRKPLCLTRDFDFNERRQLRQRNLDFIEKMETAIKVQSTTQINSQEVESKFRATEARIQANLNEQERQIKEKLEERKKNSFMRSRSSAPIPNPLLSPPAAFTKPQVIESQGGSKRSIKVDSILSDLDPMQPSFKPT